MFRLLPCALLAASLLLASCNSNPTPPTANEPTNTDDSTGVSGAQADQSVQMSTQAGPAPGPGH